MAIFGIKLDREDPHFKKFVDETNKRLNDHNVIRSPFSGKILQILYEGNPIYVANIEPLYPNYTPFIWIIGAVLFYFKGLTWVHIPIVILGALGLFWSKYFYYLMLKLGAKKSGSESKIKLITNKKIMEVTFFA